MPSGKTKRESGRAGPRWSPFILWPMRPRWPEHLVTAEYGQIIELFEGVKIRFVDAGHLLGSASVEMWMDGGRRGEEDRLLRGHWQRRPADHPGPFLGPWQADYVVMESTYGDRNHAPVASDYTAELAKIIDDTFSKGGNVIIPSFAVGRTQELLYFMREMKEEGLVKSNPDFTVCVDSPLANEATEDLLRGPAGLPGRGGPGGAEGRASDLFTFPGLTMTETSEESKLLNLDQELQGHHLRLRHVRRRADPPPPEAQPVAGGVCHGLCGLPGRGHSGPPPAGGGQARSASLGRRLRSTPPSIISRVFPLMPTRTTCSSGLTR